MGAIFSLAGSCVRSVTFRLILSAAILIFLLTQIDLDEAFRAMVGAQIELLLLAFGLTLATRFLAAYRWYLLLQGRNAAISLARILRLTFVSGFVGYFLPGGLGVDAVRILGVATRTSDNALAVTSVLIERLFGLAALVLLMFFGMAVLPQILPHGIAQLAWFGLAGIAMCLSALVHPRIRKLSLAALSQVRLARLRAGLGRIHAVVDGYRDAPWSMLWVFVLAVVFQLARCLTAAIGAAAFGVSLPFIFFIVIVPVVILLTLLPISIAGIGVQEAAFVYLFGLVGMPPEVALPLSLLLRVFDVAATLPGAWFYGRRGVGG